MCVWNYIKEYVIWTPLILSNSECWEKSAGIPNGSYFTQLIGSIVNWILINYAFIKVQSSLPVDCKVFEDDSVVVNRTWFSIYRIAEVINGLGFELNPLKSIVTSNVDEVEFLDFFIVNGFPTHGYDHRSTILSGQIKIGTYLQVEH